ncbi:MAG: DHH family phosphoesterase [Archaeoglobaceae archaeon]
MMNSTSEVNIFLDQVKKAANLLFKHDFVRIYTHHDADGIAAGAILTKSLLKSGKSFQVSFLKGLNEDFEYEKGELVIFADMGSAYPEKMSEIEADLIILDHHIPVGNIKPKRSFVHVNPHLAGFDGTYQISASGVAYYFAQEIGENKDLSPIAIVGLLGDKQKFESLNAQILKDGKERGFVEESIGINIASGKIKKVLSLSIEPYLGFFGKEDELNEFLKKVGIDGDKELDDLSIEEIQRLADALALRMLKMGAYEGIFESVFGRKLVFPKMLIKSPVLLTDVVNACGRANAMSLGASVLLNDKKSVDAAIKIYEDYMNQILMEIEKRKSEIKEGFCIRYLIMDNAPSASAIATVLSRYLMSDKPLVVINIKEGKAKISARTTEKVSQKVNLAEVMRVAAEKVGGSGGGHRVAAGANIEPSKVEEFLKEVDRLCCAMLV